MENNERKIKLAFLDLDGTLLNKNKKVGTETVTAIKRAWEEHGVRSVIATGRPLGYAKRVLKTADFGDYIISNNGGIIYDVKNEKDLYTNQLTDPQAQELHALYEDLSAYHFMVHGRLCTYYEDRLRGDKENAVPLRDNSEYQVYSISDWIKDNPNAVVSCLISGSERVLDRGRREAKHIDGVSVSGNILHGYGNPKLPFMDIYAKGCSKREAIKQLLTKLDVEREQTMAIGDGGNDLEMLNFAGVPVAMANATPEVKKTVMKHKGFITKRDNENNGVADAYEKYIF